MAELAQEQLIAALIAGTVGILLLATGIILFFFIYQKRFFTLQQRQKALEAEFQQQMVLSQIDSQEKERIRIASDLHDSLGSLLSGAKLHAYFIERSTNLKGDVKDSHRELLLALEQSIQTVKRIAWELTPEAFHLTGLSQSLKGLCERIHGKGIVINFSELGVHSVWNDDRALQVYRIAQELITNSIRHSNATSISLTITWNAGLMLLQVEDNGVGFNLDQNRRGVGWWNIEQRAKHLMAQISIGNSDNGTGSKVSIEVPFNNEE